MQNWLRHHLTCITQLNHHNTHDSGYYTYYTHYYEVQDLDPALAKIHLLMAFASAPYLMVWVYLGIYFILQYVGWRFPTFLHFPSLDNDDLQHDLQHGHYLTGLYDAINTVFTVTEHGRKHGTMLLVSLIAFAVCSLIYACNYIFRDHPMPDQMDFETTVKFTRVGGRRINTILV